MYLINYQNKRAKTANVSSMAKGLTHFLLANTGDTYNGQTDHYVLNNQGILSNNRHFTNLSQQEGQPNGDATTEGQSLLILGLLQMYRGSNRKDKQYLDLAKKYWDAYVKCFYGGVPIPDTPKRWACNWIVNGKEPVLADYPANPDIPTHSGFMEQPFEFTNGKVEIPHGAPFFGEYLDKATFAFDGFLAWKTLVATVQGTRSDGTIDWDHKGTQYDVDWIVDFAGRKVDYDGNILEQTASEPKGAVQLKDKTLNGTHKLNYTSRVPVEFGGRLIARNEPQHNRPCQVPCPPAFMGNSSDSEQWFCEACRILYDETGEQKYYNAWKASEFTILEYVDIDAHNKYFRKSIYENSPFTDGVSYDYSWSPDGDMWVQYGRTEDGLIQIATNYQGNHTLEQNAVHFKINDDSIVSMELGGGSEKDPIRWVAELKVSDTKDENNTIEYHFNLPQTTGKVQTFDIPVRSFIPEESQYKLANSDVVSCWSGVEAEDVLEQNVYDHRTATVSRISFKEDGGCSIQNWDHDEKKFPLKSIFYKSNCPVQVRVTDDNDITHYQVFPSTGGLWQNRKFNFDNFVPRKYGNTDHFDEVLESIEKRCERGRKKFWVTFVKSYVEENGHGHLESTEEVYYGYYEDFSYSELVKIREAYADGWSKIVGHDWHDEYENAEKRWRYEVEVPQGDLYPEYDAMDVEMRNLLLPIENGQYKNVGAYEELFPAQLRQIKHDWINSYVSVAVNDADIQADMRAEGFTNTLSYLEQYGEKYWKYEPSGSWPSKRDLLIKLAVKHADIKFKLADEKTDEVSLALDNADDAGTGYFEWYGFNAIPDTLGGTTFTMIFSITAKRDVPLLAYVGDCTIKNYVKNNLPYTQGIVPYSNIYNIDAYEIDGWHGCPYVGYQYPTVFYRSDSNERNEFIGRMVDFMYDAQKAYTAKFGVVGPCMQTYVWDRWDTLKYGDPNTFQMEQWYEEAWSGYEPRAFYAMANLWLELVRTKQEVPTKCIEFVENWLRWLIDYTNKSDGWTPTRFPNDKLPFVDKSDFTGHMCGLWLAGACSAKMAGCEVEGLDHFIDQCVDELKREYIVSDIAGHVMNGCWSPAPKLDTGTGKECEGQFFGFWAGEILRGLGLYLQLINKVETKEEKVLPPPKPVKIEPVFSQTVYYDADTALRRPVSSVNELKIISAPYPKEEYYIAITLADAVARINFNADGELEQPIPNEELLISIRINRGAEDSTRYIYYKPNKD